MTSGLHSSLLFITTGLETRLKCNRSELNAILNVIFYQESVLELIMQASFDQASVFLFLCTEGNIHDGIQQNELLTSAVEVQ